MSSMDRRHSGKTSCDQLLASHVFSCLFHVSCTAAVTRDIAFVAISAAAASIPFLEPLSRGDGACAGGFASSASDFAIASSVCPASTAGMNLR